MPSLVSVQGRGLLAARPAAGVAGQRYIATDAYEYYDSGSAWVEVPGPVLIADSLLAVDTATFDFSSIPANYRHLEILLSGRGANATTQEWMEMQFNGDTGNNYDGVETQWSVGGTTAAFGEVLAGARIPYLLLIPAANAPTGAVCAGRILIPDYASTTFHKYVTAEGYERQDTTTGNVRKVLGGGNWRNTAAINRIVMKPANGNWKAGSRATLRGI